MVVALADDGTLLAVVLGAVEQGKIDVGITESENGGRGKGAARLREYAAAYPDGFELRWVDRPNDHYGVKLAAERNATKAREAGEEDELA